jgi:hypothetical protein
MSLLFKILIKKSGFLTFPPEKLPKPLILLPSLILRNDSIKSSLTAKWPSRKRLTAITINQPTSPFNLTNQTLCSYSQQLKAFASTLLPRIENFINSENTSLTNDSSHAYSIKARPEKTLPTMLSRRQKRKSTRYYFVLPSKNNGSTSFPEENLKTNLKSTEISSMKSPPKMTNKISNSLISLNLQNAK